MNSISVALYKHIVKAMNQKQVFEEIRDCGVEVTRVDINRDLSYATVHWEKTDFSEVEKEYFRDTMGDDYASFISEKRESAARSGKFDDDIPITEDEVKFVTKLFNIHEGGLRSILASEMNMKYTPELRFKISRKVAESVRLEKTLDKISEENRLYTN